MNSSEMYAPVPTLRVQILSKLKSFTAQPSLCQLTLCNKPPTQFLRLWRWGSFHGDAMAISLRSMTMRFRLFLSFLTIAIGAIVFAEQSGLIVFQCFFLLPILRTDVFLFSPIFRTQNRTRQITTISHYYHNHHWCNYICSTIGTNYFAMFLGRITIVNNYFL